MKQQLVFKTEESPEYRAPDPLPRFVRLLFDPKVIKDAKMSLALFRYEPGQTCELHTHDKVVEVYYVLKGRGMATVGDEDIEVQEAMAVYIPPATGHKITCIGDEDLEFLGIFSPAHDFRGIENGWSRIR